MIGERIEKIKEIIYCKSHYQFYDESESTFVILGHLKYHRNFSDTYFSLYFIRLVIVSFSGSKATVQTNLKSKHDYLGSTYVLGYYWLSFGIDLGVVLKTNTRINTRPEKKGDKLQILNFS